MPEQGEVLLWLDKTETNGEEVGASRKGKRGRDVGGMLLVTYITSWSFAEKILKK